MNQLWHNVNGRLFVKSLEKAIVYNLSTVSS